jgi:hypothetical protein
MAHLIFLQVLLDLQDKNPSFNLFVLDEEKSK